MLKIYPEIKNTVQLIDGLYYSRESCEIKAKKRGRAITL